MAGPQGAVRDPAAPRATLELLACVARKEKDAAATGLEVFIWRPAVSFQSFFCLLRNSARSRAIRRHAWT